MPRRDEAHRERARRPAPAYRAPAPSYPRAMSCNLNGCATTNGGGSSGGSNSTITGGH
jgi:hypothetical protein